MKEFLYSNDEVRESQLWIVEKSVKKIVVYYTKV